MTITIPIRIQTGKTAVKPIIIDLVKVVANPSRKAIHKTHPVIVANFLFIFTIFLQPISSS